MGINPVIVPKYPSANSGAMPVVARVEAKTITNLASAYIPTGNGFRVISKKDELPPL